jgi:hypothetical protein
MATQASAAEDTPRSCGIESVTQVYESGDELVVLMRLNKGLLELRVPRPATPLTEESHGVDGFNPAATPC